MATRPASSPSPAPRRHPAKRAARPAKRGLALLLQAAKAQGVKPIKSIEELRGDFWPEGESLEGFSATIRQWRREGMDKGDRR